MIAVGQQHHVAIAHRVRHRFAVGGVEHLLAESLRRVDAEVVDLFERRLAVAAVVLVRRKAAPVAGRIERLADHQPTHVRDRARRGRAPRARRCHGRARSPDVVGRDRAPASRRVAPAVGDQNRLEGGLGRRFNGFAGRNVAGGGAFLEDVAAADRPADRAGGERAASLTAARRPFLRRRAGDSTRSPGASRSAPAWKLTGAAPAA